MKGYSAKSRQYVLALILMFFCFDGYVAQQHSQAGPKQNSEIAGVQFSTPPDFKLEQTSTPRVAFMRNPEISLFVAVPDKQIDDKCLTDISNVVSGILTEQDAFVWKIRPATDPRVSNYQIKRGITKGRNAKTYVQTDYVVLKIHGQEIVVGLVGTYGEGLKSAYHFEYEGAGYSFVGWRALFQLISSITGEKI